MRSKVFLLLVISVLLGTCSVSLAEEKVRLDGEWDFLPASQLEVSSIPDNADWQKIIVPSTWNRYDDYIGGDWGAYDNFLYPKEWDKVNCAWYKRTFSVPEDWQGSRVFIHFDAVLHNAYVYVNGEFVGKHIGGFTPFEFDITDKVHWIGPNTLLVGVEGQKTRGGKILQPAGSWWGHRKRGIWQSVFLIKRPQVYINDIFIRTSWREKRIYADVEIVNTTAEEKNLRVVGVVFDGEKPVLDMSREISVAPGSKIVVKLKENWVNPKLWSPDSPYLYKFKVDVYLKNGWKVDTMEEKFGFREVWIEGTDFYLNGHKIRFKGDAWHYMGAVMQNRRYARLWYKFAKDSGCNILRLHAQPYPEFYLDIADEMGIFIIDESPVYGSMGTIPVEDKEFWENAKVAIEEFVRRDRNHPSVIIWSACNEVTWVPNGKKAIEPLLELGNLIKSLDPTRPVGYDGDYDLGGKAELLVGHYGGGWGTWNNIWKKDKPILLDEFSQFFFGDPRQACKWIGDSAYESFDKRLEGVGLEAEKFIRDFRYYNVAGITPWNLVWYSLKPLPFGDGKGIDILNPPTGIDEMPLKRVGGYSATLNPGYDKSLPEWIPNPAYKHIKEAFKPLYVDVRELDTNFYGDTYLARTVVVYNDTNTPRRLKTVWRALVDGDLLEEKEYIADYAPYEKKIIILSIKLPAVEKISFCHLSITLYDEKGTQLFSTEKIYKIRPQPHLQIKQGVFVFDPEGVLKIEGATGSIEKLEKFLKRGKILIIAPHLNEDSQIALVKEAEKLENFVKNGGIVISFAQEAINWTPFPITLKSVWTKLGFIRAYGHPLLEGIEDEDLKYWGGDGPIATMAFERKKNFGRALIDGGEESQDVFMLEIPYGKGAYIFCQLENKCPPVYETILANALAGKFPEYKKGEVLVLADEDSALVALLEQLRGNYTINSPVRDKWELIIADAGNKGVFDFLLDKFDWLVARAKNIILFNVRKEGWVSLARVLPPGLEMTQVQGKMVNLVKSTESMLTWGLSNADLFVPEGIIEEGFLIKDKSMWQGILVRPQSDWGGWIGKYSAEQVKTAAIRRSEKILAKEPPYYGLVSSNIGNTGIYLCSIKMVPSIAKEMYLRPLLENLGMQFMPPLPPPTKSIDIGNSREDVRYIKGAWNEPQITSLYPQDFPIFGQRHSFRSISHGVGEIVFKMPTGFNYKVTLVISSNGVYTALINDAVNFTPVRQEEFEGETFACLEGIIDLASNNELSIKIIPKKGVTVKLYGVIVTPDTPCRTIVDEEGFIRSWLIMGPFKDEGEILDKAFVADERALEGTPGEKIAGRIWREYISPSWDINLQAETLFGEEEHCAAYALTYIYVPEDKAEQYKNLQLLIGSDDSIKVWLNGDQIWKNITPRPVSADKDRIKGVSLKPGVNKLLIKVVNYEGGWGFCARFATSAGVPIKNFW